MNFLQPGASLTAANWNALFAAADAQLTTMLGGMSSVLAACGRDFSTNQLGADKQWDRGFFFGFDPVNPPLTLHPVALQFIKTYLTQFPTYQNAMFWRQYNHAAITGQLSGLSQSGNTSKWKVVKLALPTWAAWSAAVYPSGFGTSSNGGLTQTISGTVYPAYNCLDCSLQVHKANVGGTPYNVTFDSVVDAEHAQPFKGIDVFALGNFSWDTTNWNKYSIVRFHNMGQTASTATFGGASASVPPGGSKCFRLVAGTWQVNGNYFHWMATGDGRFLQVREAGNPANNSQTGGAPSILMPGIVTDVLLGVMNGTGARPIASAGNFAMQPDITKFFDLSPVYNNAAYTRSSPVENNPPTGGYFPALSTADLIGDLIISRGQFVAINPANANKVFVNFTGFAALAASLAGTGLSSRALSETHLGQTINNLEIYASTNWHLIDLSCPLVTFLTGGNAPASIIGTSQSSNPPSLKLPWLTFAATTMVDNPSSSVLGYRDLNGNSVNVTLNNDGSTTAAVTKVFLPTDSIAALQAWISGQSTAGGILSVGNFQLLSTTFGMVMTWDEVWPLNAQFAGVLAYALGSFSSTGQVRTLKIIFNGTGLNVTRAFVLNETKFGAATNGVWPVIGAASEYLFWNYARVDRQFINSRWYDHLSADIPWMPNLPSANFATPGWSNQKLPTPNGGVYQDELSTNEFNSVVSFYEVAPMGVDTVASPAGRDKPGISRMGVFSKTPDIWSPFSYWLAGNTSLTYPNSSGGNTSIGTGPGATWYLGNEAALMSNATISDPIPNALPCQMEHFNAIASMANGIPPFKWFFANAGFQFNTNFTLNFAAANIIIVNGGSGYVAGDAIGFNLKVSGVDSNGAITGVTQNGTVVVNTYNVYSTPLRPFGLGNSATGSGATCDTSSGDGSLLNFIPTHTTIAVPTVPEPPNSAGDDFYDRMTDSYCPREAFFSWNGATTGGADPVANYLTGLSVGIQSTLPDSYGAPLPIYEYDLHNDGSLTSNRVSGYQYGCDANFQVVCNTYRWISISSARTLYSAFSIPFVLSELLVPYSWQVFNINTPAPSTSVRSATAIWGWNEDYPGTFFIPGSGGSYGAPYNNSPPAPATQPNSGGGDLGPVNQIQADFFNDGNGNWVRPYRSENICSDSSPLAGPNRFWLGQWNFNTTIKADYNINYAFSQDWTGFGSTVHTDEYTYTETKATMQGTLAIPSQFAPAGVVGGLLVNYPQKSSYDLVAVLARYEGTADQCQACLPQNVAYQDDGWVAANLSFYSSHGTSYVPIIVDNSVEGAFGDVTYVSGAGGETIITTGLTNARLLTVPVDGQIQNNPPPSPGGL